MLIKGCINCSALPPTLTCKLLCEGKRIAMHTCTNPSRQLNAKTADGDKAVAAKR